MDYEEILKQCCTKECKWGGKKLCHKVDLYNIILTEDDFKFLSTIHVHTLRLNHNNIGENGAKYLSKNKTLHTLDLSDNNIGDNGAKYFKRAIIPNLRMDEDEICETSKKNYNDYIQKSKNILLRYMIKDLTNIVICYLKND